MKLPLLMLAFMVSIVCAQAQKKPTPEQRAKLEAKNGIRDIKLDTPKSLYTDLFEVKNEFPCGNMMRRTNESLYFGKAKVDSIRYLYLNDTLKAIILDFVPVNGNGYFQLGSVLQKLYGPPTYRFREYFNLDQVEMEAGSNCFQEHEYVWYSKTFTIVSYYNGGPAYIRIVKHDLKDKCVKLLHK